MKARTIYLLLLCALFIPAYLYAIDEGEPCEELVRECFAKNGTKRDSCFFTVSKHPFCDGSELGRLTLHRWTTSASTVPEGSRGLFGPAEFDQACVENCDSRWISSALHSETTPELIEEIHSCLESCRIKKLKQF
jgi:hypothetical protein